jgi:hypothetical protein
MVPRRTHITVLAEAEDNVGVTKVEFRRNGELWCTTNAPYYCSIYTDDAVGKTITFEARAYDPRGNTARSAVAVTTRR